eukprot:gene7342-14989_t
MRSRPWTNTKYSHCEMETSISRTNDLLYVFATTCHKFKDLIKKYEVLDVEADDDQVDEYYEKFDWYDKIYNNQNTEEHENRDMQIVDIEKNNICKLIPDVADIAATVARLVTSTGTIDKENSSMSDFAATVARPVTSTGTIDKEDSSMSDFDVSVGRLITSTQKIDVKKRKEVNKELNSDRIQKGLEELIETTSVINNISEIQKGDKEEKEKREKEMGDNEIQVFLPRLHGSECFKKKTMELYNEFTDIFNNHITEIPAK